jgi:uncharacterized protein YndB with AHSA1/START domain
MATSTAAAATSPASEFVISRSFDAPREKVWKAFSEDFQSWFTPKGFTVKQANMDFRAGGTYHYCFATPNGQEMWGKARYQEITEPDRLVWINSFSDETGATARNPWSETWPLELLTEVTLKDQSGKTTVTVQWVPIDPTDEERKTFDEGHDSMRGGWTGTLDQLEAYLARGVEE